MPIEVDAIYENGTLKLDHPLPLTKHQRVKVVIQGTGSLAQQAYGIIGWTGDPETVQKIALDPEAGALESP